MTNLFLTADFKEVFKAVNTVFELSKDVKNYQNTVKNYLVSESNSDNSILDSIICYFYKDYLGSINTKELLSQIKKVKGLINLNKFCFNPEYFGATTTKTSLGFCGIKLLFENCNLEDDFIASATTLKDINLSDNDCYETAGGYRHYLLKKGEKVYFKLDKTTAELIAVYNVSLITDHYNNNLFGVSTGNGTSQYEYGQNKKVKQVYLKTHDFLEIEDISELKIDIEKVKKITSEKIKNL